jgi:hypothetical protein
LYIKEGVVSFREAALAFQSDYGDGARDLDDVFEAAWEMYKGEIGSVAEILGRPDVQRKLLREPAMELAVRLNLQRSKWLIAVAAELQDARSVLPDALATDLAAAHMVASAFQAVHVCSFIAAKGYVESDDVSEFTAALCRSLAADGVTDEWKQSASRYTELKTKPHSEQLLALAEDVMVKVSGSDTAGAIVGPGFVPLANEFLIRSLGISADHFGDERTTSAMADAVTRLHDGA